MEIVAENLKTVSLDHHGIVASVCKDLGLSDKIDARIGSGDKRRLVSPGKAVIAMILNGLGFTNHRLYICLINFLKINLLPVYWMRP